ncbi:MAG: DUF4268 domain-containing protein [Candidatus Rokubacteria bacterium]|nr:DUF4268 domain-containing protein [Candidatus Rokubacteria bacterium]MBI3454855.1 DUF4268 domain-containing protein [Candidatus Rokubacteria bacterium]
MYLVNKDTKSLEAIPKAAFRDVGMKERKDLQEWIVHNPEVFGEDLLVIQKEFSGFADTKERVDVLALDKQGNIVIIENKLDDSGRDVVWQVLKYASYCASLTNLQIKDIMLGYLRASGRRENADEILSEFLEDTDFDSKLNTGNTQRIFMVSGDFRKEVTSTVLWLSRYGLRIQCFKASVYALKDQLLFNLEQIIPIKDVGDYEIRMAEKNLAEVSSREEVKNRHVKRLEFWSQFLKHLNTKTQIAAKVSPSRDNWIGLGLGMAGGGLTAVVSQKYARAEVFIDRGDRGENKRVFDLFANRKREIEEAFGDRLAWERMDDKVTSRIKFQRDDVVAFDSAGWQEINEFLSDAIIRMERTFRPEVRRIH